MKYISWITGGNVAGDNTPGIRLISVPSSTMSILVVVLVVVPFALGLTLSIEASLAAGDTSPPLQKLSEETPVSRWTVVMKSSTVAWMTLGETA